MLAVFPASASAASATDCNGSPTGTALDPGSFNDFWVRGGPGWTGGDGALSVPIGDGRTLWIFSDTFLGTVNPDGSRPADSPFVHNVLAIQDGGCVTTYYGGTDGEPQAFFDTGDSSRWYWLAGGLISGGKLKILLNRYRSTGTGLWDWTFEGNAVAVVSLADMHVESVTDLPSSGVRWSGNVLKESGYTYVYGVDGANGQSYVHVARVPGDEIDDPSAWRYYATTGWTADETASSRQASGVSDGFTVVKTQTGYTLISQGRLLSRKVNEYPAAPGPQGPWLTSVTAATIPDPGPGLYTYNATVHPEFNDGGQMLIGYSVNSTDGDHTSADSYRPRFMSIPIPDYGAAPVTPVTPGTTPDPPPAGPPAKSGPTSGDGSGGTAVGAEGRGVLRLSARRLVVGRHGRVRVRLKCLTGSGRCSGSLTLKGAVRRRRPGHAASLIRLGSARFAVPAGRTATVRLLLHRSALARLRRSRRARGELRASLRGDAPRVVRRRVVLVARRSR